MRIGEGHILYEMKTIVVLFTKCGNGVDAPVAYRGMEVVCLACESKVLVPRRAVGKLGVAVAGKKKGKAPRHFDESSDAGVLFSGEHHREVVLCVSLLLAEMSEARDPARQEAAREVRDWWERQSGELSKVIRLPGLPLQVVSRGEGARPR